MPNYFLGFMPSKGAEINYGHVADEAGGNVSLGVSFKINDGIEAEFVGSISGVGDIYKIGTVNINALIEGIDHDTGEYGSEDALNYNAVYGDADTVEFMLVAKRASGGD